MSTSKDRLLTFLSEKRIGQSKCEEMAGISRGYIANNKGNIGSKILNRISKAFPDLNVDWLVNGIGDMFCPPVGGTSEEDIDKGLYGTNIIQGDGNHHNSQSFVDKEKEVELLKKIIADKDEEIKFLRELLRKK